MVMSPEAGGIVNVKGTMSATAIVAVKPGSAPTMMPSTIAINM